MRINNSTINEEVLEGQQQLYTNAGGFGAGARIVLLRRLQIPVNPGFSGHVMLYRPTHHCPPVFSFYTDVLLARNVRIPTEQRTEIHNLYTTGRRTVVAPRTTKLIAFCRRRVLLPLHLLHSGIPLPKDFFKKFGVLSALLNIVFSSIHVQLSHSIFNIKYKWCFISALKHICFIKIVSN